VNSNPRSVGSDATGANTLRDERSQVVGAESEVEGARAMPARRDRGSSTRLTALTERVIDLACLLSFGCSAAREA